MIIVVMGVAGAGKTTIGRLLADALKWRFYEADDFHPQANIAKMRAGVALTDADRRPWLIALRDLIRTCDAQKLDAIVTCSALKQEYRDLLGCDSAAVRLVYLRASRQLIATRLAGREGHFFNPTLIDAQFETLQEPHSAIVVDSAASPLEIVADLRARLQI